MTSEPTSAGTPRRLCLFLAHYSATLLGCGATCIRLTKNVERIAASFGYRAEITIMPRHVHLSVTDSQGTDVVTAIESVPQTGISFALNTELSRLSWKTADSRLSLEECSRQFDDIVRYADSRHSRTAELLLASAANASFCRLFGGDAIAMAVVLVATMAGYYIKQLMLSRRIDLRLTVTVCAFVSSVISAADSLFSLGTTPAIALGTSVLYLVPGIPFLNSFSDLLYRHYICAFSRFVDAVVLTCCLSAGLCAGMVAMNSGTF